MGEAERYQDYKRPGKRLTLGDDSNALVALVTINIIFFILLLVLEAIYGNVQGRYNSFSASALPYFQLPASISDLLVKPWTLLTFMFTHIKTFDMIGSMLWLWAFGYIFQELTGNRKLIPLYIYGGLAAAFVFILSANLLPVTKHNTELYMLVGAHGSNMAIAVAATMLAPDYRFFRHLGGGVPIWVLTLIYVIVDAAGVVGMAAPFSLAHLSGAASGFLFVYFIRRGYDGSVWMNNFYNWVMSLFSPRSAGKSESVKEKVFYNTGQRRPYRKTSNVTQQRIDEILDKINQKGYHFLTEEEKNILKRAAEEGPE